MLFQKIFMFPSCNRKIEMKSADFHHWLERYGKAWIHGKPRAAIRLFSENAAYYEEPFHAPMVGREAIQKYWTEGAKEGQQDITFDFQIISLNNSSGYAHWQATFRRVSTHTQVALDGILLAKFNRNGECTEFREWWHRQEL